MFASNTQRVSSDYEVALRLRNLLDCGAWTASTKENIANLKRLIRDDKEFYTKHAVIIRETKGKLGDGAGNIQDVHERHFMKIDRLDGELLERFIRADFSIETASGKKIFAVPDHVGNYPRLKPLDASEPLWGYDVKIQYGFHKAKGAT